MQAEDIIEPSELPWCAQVPVTANENHKKTSGDRLLANRQHIHADGDYPLPKYIASRNWSVSAGP